MTELQRVYKASQAAQQLEALLLSTEESGGDATLLMGQIDVLAATASTLGGCFDDLLSVAAEITMRASTRKQEAARLTALAKRDEAMVAFMKQQVMRVMQESAVERMETPLHKLSIASAGGKQSMEIVGDVPPEFTMTEIVPNKELIRSKLEAGEQLNFALLHPRTQTLRIT